MRDENCKSCVIASANDDVTFIYADDLWTVNLRLGSPPPRLVAGWAVLQPRRHVRNLSQLNREEQESLGQVLSRCESAMQEALGATRMYVCLFAESDEFHLHFHLIPRYDELPKGLVGPAVFQIDVGDADRVTADELESLRIRLSEKLAR